MRRLLSIVIASALAAATFVAVRAQTPGRAVKPVTDEMLANPSPNDWLAWRGTGKSQGLSALDQINRGNVGRLQVAWAWTMEPGTQESAPIVHDGVMYLGNPGGIVQALDAATGDLLWEYRPPPAQEGGQAPTGTLRGIGIYGDKVFVNVPDGRVVALSARDGKPVWTTQVQMGDSAARFSTAPVVTRGGRIVSAMSGCSRFVEEKCAIVAHDAATGKELWRTHTIPKSGQPGFESWGDVPYLYRAGTEMWIPGSYDVELNLIYWSTSQAKPFTRAARGTDGDALYSNSTLALDPETGKIVWHHQQLPGESHDMDEVFENVLVDVGSRKSLFKMGKIAILWEIDRRTGKFVRATDLLQQDLVDLDPKTGVPTYKPGRLPKLGEPIDACPGAMGGKDWPSMAYSPETQALYIPHLLACSKVTFTAVEKKPGGGGAGIGPMSFYPDPRFGGNVGGLVAMDAATGKTLWHHKQKAAFVSAVLTTAGGLAFVADYNRFFYAFDVRNGKIVWQTRLATAGHGFPMSYAVNGRQYIAIPIGVGTPWIDMFGKQLMPDLQPGRPGNALVVFALPQN